MTSPVGFINGVCTAYNGDFSGLTPTVNNGLVSDNQIWIGSTALNAGGTHVNVKTITAGSGIVLNSTSSALTISSSNGGIDLHTARFIVSAGGNADGANYTTIQNAINNATSGSTVFIQPGTYTENLTLKAGVNLTAFGSDSSQNATGDVIINGTCTLTTAGSVTISGIQLQTNSAALLAVTGTLASIVNLNNCYLNMTNATGITYSSSSASSAINIKNCNGNLGTTGIAIFAHSSAGTLSIDSCILLNSGLSTTANTISAGLLTTRFSTITNPITSSGTSQIGIQWTQMDMSSLGNVTALTVGGSNNGNAFYSYFASGTASAISVGSVLAISTCNVVSSNTNAITGAGTLQYNLVTFGGTSSKINTSVLSAFNIDAGGVSFDGGTNILNQYTEGTFNPTAVGGSTAGSTTYVTQTGRYTRIGRSVFINFLVNYSAATGTGVNTIGALPFTINNVSNVFTNPIGVSGVTFTASYTNAVLNGQGNTTTAQLGQNGSAQTNTTINIANANQTIFGNYQYFV